MSGALPLADPGRFVPQTMRLPGSTARFLARRSAAAGTTVIVAMAAVALLADFLASDRPIALHRDGRTYLLSNLFDYADLRGVDNRMLRRNMRPGDWAVFPLHERGPYSLAGFDEGGPPPQPPGGGRFLGTDNAGRDTFARLVHGTRVSLAVGAGATLLCAALGTALGLAAGYFGGKVDLVVVRLAEIVLNFPLLFILLAVQGLLSRASLAGMVAAIALTRWCEPCLLVRAEARRVRTQGYVEAARALGATPARVLWRHVLPNSVTPLYTAVPLGIASVVLLESALGFLGFGAPEPLASWGGLLADGFRGIGNPAARPLLLLPGLAVFAAASAFNLVGEALRDALDPRSTGGA